MRPVCGALVALVGVIGLTLVGIAEATTRGRRPPLPWADLESALKRQGENTDTASLIRLAASRAEEGKRWMAIEILGLRNERAAADALRKLLGTEDSPLLKETSALALARLGDQVALTALENLMEAATRPERQVFLAARLAELGTRSGYKYLIEAAASQDANLRYATVAALVAFVGRDTAADRPAAGDVLLSLLGDKDPRVRREVLINLPIAVGKGLSAATVMPPMRHVAENDPDPTVREMARLALSSLGDAPQK